MWGAKEEKNKEQLEKGGEQKVMTMLQTKSKKSGYRKRMQEIWKQEVMKELREQQLCDQMRQIEEKQSL